MKSTKIIKIVICHLFIFNALAQDITRELILVRPYEPSVGDAQKITTLPNLRDTFTIRPTFEYSIQSRRIDTRFDVTPITPARLQPLPQTRLYHGYIKIGAGTLPNVLTEVAINTLRNRNYSAGALFNLDRAAGNVRICNGTRVFAGYNDISSKVFGQRFFRNNTILYGDLRASGQTAYNYGYDTKAVDRVGNRVDTLLNRSDITKRYFFSDANIGFRSSHFRTNQLNYDMRLGYKFARNKLGGFQIPNFPDPDRDVVFNENAINFKAQLDNNMFGGNVKLDFFTRSHAFDTLRNNFALDLNPWFMLDNDSVRMKAGMRLFIYKEGDNIMQYGIAPNIEFQFTLLKDIFIPFVGVDGFIQPHTFRDIVTVNPFITPGTVAPMSRTKLQIYAGLKGTITQKLSYYLRGDFSTSDNEHFFVNDIAYSNLQNHFTVITDNLNTLRLKGELYFNPIESIELGLKASHFTYQPSRESRAWHRPNFTLDFTARYNLRNKIIANLDLMCIGKRYAKAYPDLQPNFDNEFYRLDPIYAINLGVEYRYTRNFSFFLRLNNLTGAQYYRWNFFPSRRFNAMLGFTYSL